MSSCASFTEIHFDILRPAGFSVPPEIKTVVLIDNAVDFPDTVANIIKVDEEIVRMDTTKVRDYPLHVIKTVAEELNQRMFFDTVYIDTLKYKKPGRATLLNELSDVQIDSICRKFGVDAIISLDAYKYTNDISIVSISDFEYYSSYDASALNYWRIIRCSDHHLLNDNLQKDTIFWENTGESINSSLRTFPDFKTATYDIGEYLAGKYVDYISPYWEDATRRLYTNGNMNFINATEWVNRDNWKEAKKIWNYIYNNGSKKAQIKAALNIATAFEKDGDIDNAIAWAYKAYKNLIESSRGSTKLKLYVFSYYKELSVRKREKRKLIEQLGEF